MSPLQAFRPAQADGASHGAFPRSRSLFEQMWSALDGSSDVADAVSFVGAGALPGPYAFTDLAAASIATAAAAVGELISAAGHSMPEITVDRILSSGWFTLPSPPTVPLPGAARPHHKGDFSFFTQLPTADDRWVWLHGMFPSARERIMRALGVSEDIDEAARVIRAHSGEEVEQRLVDGDAIAALSRTTAEWRASAAGIAVDSEPLAHLTVHPAGGSSWCPTPGRPLAGLRVLDLTRVIAGPTGTRFLASLGAEVLRLDRPGSDESRSALGHGPSHMIGKRWAYLDIASDAGRRRFAELLAQADVLVHGYRPGAIDSLISEEERRRIRPDLVEVSLRAYGWTGPWANRRGFDSVVQYSVGLGEAMRSWAKEDPEQRSPLWLNGRQVDINGLPNDTSRPRHTPVEALDLSTGYQIAAAALRGLTRRLQTGAGSSTRYSLARTASLLLRTTQDPDQEPEIRLPLAGPLEDRIYSSPSGPSNRLVQPVSIAGTPLFWERPEERVGSSAPVWTF